MKTPSKNTILAEEMKEYITQRCSRCTFFFKGCIDGQGKCQRFPKAEKKSFGDWCGEFKYKMAS